MQTTAGPVSRHLALRALRSWRGELIRVVKRGIERKEIRRKVDPKKLAGIVISSLEGALMMSRLDGDRGVLSTAQSYLNSNLDTQARLQG
jgi:hypothetical protein